MDNLLKKDMLDTVQNTVKEGPRCSVIIGLIGKICSGKETVSEKLNKRGLRIIEGSPLPMAKWIERSIELSRIDTSLEEKSEALRIIVNDSVVALKQSF